MFLAAQVSVIPSILGAASPATAGPSGARIPTSEVVAGSDGVGARAAWRFDYTPSPAGSGVTRTTMTRVGRGLEAPHPSPEGFRGPGKAGARNAVTSRKASSSDSMDQPFDFFTQRPGPGARTQSPPVLPTSRLAVAQRALQPQVPAPGPAVGALPAESLPVCYTTSWESGADFEESPKRRFIF